MSQNPTITLREARGATDVLNVTFAFIRQNLTILVKCLLYIVGPIYVLYAVSGGVMQAYMLGSASEAATGLPTGPIGVFYLNAIVLGGLSATLQLVVGLGVVRLYQERGPEGFSVGDVWQSTRRHFGRMLGTALVLGLLFMGSAVIIIVPCLGALAWLVGAVYFGVVFSLIFPMRMYEDVDLYEGLVRCRALVEGHWWQTLGVSFLAVVTASVMALLFQAPTLALTGLGGLLSSDVVTSGPFWQGMLVLSSLLSGLGGTLLNAIPILALAVHYFNLVERKEHVGLAERVDALLPDDAPRAASEQPTEEADDERQQL